MSRIQHSKDFNIWQEFFNKKKHLNDYEISKFAVEKFGGSRQTWTSRFESIRQLSKNNEQLLPKNKLQEEHEKADNAFLTFIGKDYPYIQPKKNYSKKIINEKIINVSDPHEPYSFQPVWDDIYKNHHDAAHIHVNGDIADFYSKSRFKKTVHEEFSNELKVIFERLEWLSTNWKKITLIRGNHDNRVEKLMASLVNSDMLFLTKTDLLSYLCAFFDNIELVGERITSTDGTVADIDFIWQCGDIIFTHIERSQKQSSGLLETISNQMHRWSKMFNLKPYRVIMQGHNHRCTFDTNGAEYLYICPMAACLTTNGLKYALSPSLNGVPPITGYIEIYQKDGITDVNKTRIKIFE